MKENNKYTMDMLLRQRLRSSEAPVPGDLWQRIEAARKPRRDPFPFWAGLSLLVVVTAGMAAWMSLAPQGTASGGQGALPGDAVTREMPATGNGIAVQAEAPLPSRSQDNPKMTSATAVPSAEANSADAGFGDARENTTAGSSPAAASSSSVSSPAAPASAAASSSVPTSGGSNSTAPAAGDRSGKAAPKVNRPIKKVDKPKVAPTKPTADSGEGVEGQSDPFAALGDPAPGSERTNIKDRTEGATGPLFFLQQRRSATIGGMTAARELLGAPILPGRVPSCYSFHSLLRGLSVDLYVAPEYAARQMVYRDEASMAHATRRNETERYAFAWSAGFRASAHFRGGLALRTGLTYTDIMERFRTNDPDAEITRVITVKIDTVYDGPTPVIKIDTLSIVEYGQRDKVDLNHYRFVDIPLTVGYEMDRGRWFMSLNAGLLFNIATAQRGTILAMDGMPVSIDSDAAGAQHPYKTRVGSSFQMALGINYALAPRLHLILEPQFRVWLRPLNIPSYPIDQKYVNAGLAIGIRRYI